MYYIYRHIRLDNNKPFYIGIGKESKTYNRSKDVRRNNIWKNITAKTEYRIEILISDLSYSEALEKEKEFVALYGKICDNSGCLANIMDYGSGRVKNTVSFSEKSNSSERMKGNNYAKGKKWSLESKLKMSISRRGQKNNLGRRWITNGIKNKMIKSTDNLPETYYYGVTKLNNINNLKPLTTN